MYTLSWYLLAGRRKGIAEDVDVREFIRREIQTSEPITEWFPHRQPADVFHDPAHA